MPLLGAHMSIAGGYYKAVEQAGALSMDTCQIFTKNNNQWRAKKITDKDVSLFREALARHDIRHPIAHSSYLINIASPNAELWKKSVDALIVEMQRAEQLGLDHVVLHPGSHTTSSAEEGIEQVIAGLNEMDQRVGDIRCRCLLETTAGQGSNLGWRFEQLATILDGVDRTERLGVCVDTCHMFAAGYALKSEADYAGTWQEFDDVIGLSRIKAFHLNDSKREFGSRVDRHEHIGRGELGLAPFRRLLNDPRFQPIPMYLETAKGTEDGEDLDAIESPHSASVGARRLASPLPRCGRASKAFHLFKLRALYDSPSGLSTRLSHYSTARKAIVQCLQSEKVNDLAGRGGCLTRIDFVRIIGR